MKKTQQLQFLRAAESNCAVHLTIYVVGFMYFWQSNHIANSDEQKLFACEVTGVCLLLPTLPAAVRLTRSPELSMWGESYGL